MNSKELGMSCLYASFRNLGITMPMVFFLLMLGRGCLGVCVGSAVILLIAMILGFAFPATNLEEIPSAQRILFSLLGCIGVFLCGAFVVVTLVFLVDRLGVRDLEKNYTSYAEMRSDRSLRALPIEKLMPNSAKGIHVKSLGGGSLFCMGRSIVFSCHITLPEYSSFAEGQNGLSSTNSCVLEAVLPKKLAIDRWLKNPLSCGDRIPEGCFKYESRSGAGRGLWLLFDAESETLYGRYLGN